MNLLGIKTYDNEDLLKLEMNISKSILIREGLLYSLKDVCRNSSMKNKDLGRAL